jgi:tetratricopeptide (TPR) repeat protein
MMACTGTRLSLATHAPLHRPGTLSASGHCDQSIMQNRVVRFSDLASPHQSASSEAGTTLQNSVYPNLQLLRRPGSKIARAKRAVAPIGGLTGCTIARASVVLVIERVRDPPDRQVMARASLAAARQLTSEEIERRTEISARARSFLRLVIDNEKAAPVKYRPTAKLVNRACAYVADGRFEEGLARCDRALVIDRDDGFAHGVRAYALIGLARFAEGLDAAERAAALFPENHWAAAHTHFLRGAALIRLRRFEESLAASERAVALAPNQSVLHELQATALLHLKRFPEALDAAGRALALDENNGEAHAARGNALLMLGRLGEALDEANRAVPLIPDRGTAYVLRANVLGQLGRYGEILGDADRVITLSPTNAYAHLLRGRALHTIGRYAEALEAAEQAVALASNDTQVFLPALLLRGTTLFELWRFTEALRDASQAIELEAEQRQPHVDSAILLSRIAHQLNIGESNSTVYTGEHGGPVGDAADIAEADIMDRVRKLPRDKLPALAKLVEDFEAGAGALTDDTRLGRLQARFERRLREIELPEGGFKTLAQFKAGNRLKSTFYDLRDVERELGREIEKPEKVAQTEAFISAWDRSHDKNGAPVAVRPVGRPRRAVGEQQADSSRSKAHP